MTDIVTAIILGIIEGVTEFLPVSSTGHMILAAKAMHVSLDQWALFIIVIQLGAILAIVTLYWRTFWAVAAGLLRRDATAIRFTRNILVAFVPAAVIGAVLHKKIEALLDKPVVVAVALIAGGVAILLVERVVREGRIKGVAEVPLPTVIGIGLIQCLAMVPGVSRSGATILGALSLGVERRTAAEFSFFLAIPTMLGATVFELVSKRHELASAGGVGFGLIGVGLVVSFLVALLVVRWFVGLVGRSGFSPFGWYRIIVGAIALAELPAR